MQLLQVVFWVRLASMAYELSLTAMEPRDKDWAVDPSVVLLNSTRLNRLNRLIPHLFDENLLKHLRSIIYMMILGQGSSIVYDGILYDICICIWLYKNPLHRQIISYYRDIYTHILHFYKLSHFSLFHPGSLPSFLRIYDLFGAWGFATGNSTGHGGANVGPSPGHGIQEKTHGLGVGRGPWVARSDMVMAGDSVGDLYRWIWIVYFTIYIFWYA